MQSRKNMIHKCIDNLKLGMGILNSFLFVFFFCSLDCKEKFQFSFIQYYYLAHNCSNIST